MITGMTKRIQASGFFKATKKLKLNWAGFFGLLKLIMIPIQLLYDINELIN